MTNPGHGPWEPVGFDDRITSWIQLCSPEAAIIGIVKAWVNTRRVDPFQGMEREPGFENLWHGPVPGTWDRRRDRIVYCSYTVDPSTNTVTCNDITTLGWPV